MAGGDKPSIVFKAESISYTFPNGRTGLHELQLAETSGKLIGIMGGSGSGKSTLLSVLNGSLKPTRGRSPLTGSMFMPSAIASAVSSVTSVRMTC
ncbi:MAG: ATP-binding cassette domain-containing protein [Flavobacteriales bacterium]|nr:ATP-binding cassette domain-containing protein [Flavobacteriales bacterium]